MEPNNASAALIALQPISFLHRLHQAARIEDIHQIRRKRRDRILFSMTFYGLIDGNRDLIALLHITLELVILDQQQTIVDGVAEEDAREGLRDHTLDAERLDDLRCLLSLRPAAEVLPRDDHIAFPDLSRKLRAQW